MFRMLASRARALSSLTHNINKLYPSAAEAVKDIPSNSTLCVCRQRRCSLVCRGFVACVLRLGWVSCVRPRCNCGCDPATLRRPCGDGVFMPP